MYIRLGLHMFSFPNIPPLLQIKTKSPQTPAAAPSKLPITFLPVAPDCGAAVLLARGVAVVDDDELEGVGKGVVEEEEAEEAAAELEVARVLGPCEVEVEVEVTVVAVGAGKDDVSVMIAVGTEAVDTKPSVDAKIVPLAADDTPAPALEAAPEAVDMEL